MNGYHLLGFIVCVFIGNITGQLLMKWYRRRRARKVRKHILILLTQAMRDCGLDVPKKPHWLLSALFDERPPRRNGKSGIFSQGDLKLISYRPLYNHAPDVEWTASCTDEQMVENLIDDVFNNGDGKQ